VTLGPGIVLGIDTATLRAVVAIGARAGSLVAADIWLAGYRHGEELLPRIDALLRGRGMDLSGIDAVAVGTGPGAFTGLRVGMATAKGLAHGLGRPIVGIATSASLLVAARSAGVEDPIALLSPAGPSDRVVVVTDATGDAAPARRIGPDEEPDVPPGATIVAVDLEGRADKDAVVRGEAAVGGLASALVGLAAERLANGMSDDLGGLAPEYVTLPRGVLAPASGAVTVARG
jgi:tRNA threonylcarbamoyl adenosine modification protein YeaZ